MMKKFFTHFIAGCLVASGLCFPSSAEAAAFEIEQTFDNSADFPGGANLPEGWSDGGANFLRREADYFGFPAKSGDYVLGKSGAAAGDMLFTPMMKLKGGKPCKISFSYMAPNGGQIYVYSYGLDIKAGKAQTAEAQTIAVGSVEGKEYAGWTNFSFEFTPDNDGEYCFSLTVTAYLPTGSGRAIGFEDFFITGEEGDGGETPIDPPAPVEGESFELEYNFDEDADYPDGATLPQGWNCDGAPFQRAEATDFGFFAKSGDYILGKASAGPDNVIYTPMVKLVGGAKCTLELYFVSPAQIYVYSNGIDVKAGPSQNVADHTYKCGSVEADVHNEWEKHTFEFTPAEDGEYCFSIAITNGMVGPSPSGVAFDDVFISGMHPKEDTPAPLEPNEDNLADCIDLPYIETFSDASHYDGANLPSGWHSTGSTVWVTANLGKLLAAVEGDYYMVTPNSTFERDEKAYTPFFNMTEGTEYTISFYSMIEGGWDDDGNMHKPTLDFSVGTEQDIDFHRTLLAIDNQHTAWEKHEITFTPEISGPYCFAFALSGEANTGIVAVDYLNITAPGLQARVEPSFAPMGVFDLYTSQMLAFSGKPVEFVNTTRYGESYAWTLLLGEEEIATSTEINPSFDFAASGKYTLTLAATNSRGTRSTSKTIEVIVVSDGDGNSDLALSLLNERSDMIVDRGNIPCFGTDPEADFITGYNHYYNKIAQRFSLPEGTEMWVKQLSFWVTDRRFVNVTATSTGDDRTKPFSVVFYGAKEDGSLDPETVFGRYDTTIGDAMGAIGLGAISGEGRFIDFPEAIKIVGPVFVAMEFPSTMTIDAEDPNLGRSYISTSCVKFGHGRGNLYAQPFAVPEGSVVPTDGSWCKLGDLDPSLSAYGANWELWVSMEDPEMTGITAVNPDGETVFAVSLDSAGNIMVSGTVAGETVTVYSVSGALVASACAEEGCTVIPASHLGTGIYIVNAGAGYAKIVK